MDHTIFRWINNLTTHISWANGIARFYADYGVVLFAVLLVIAYVEARRADDRIGLATAIWAAGAALVAVGIGQIISPAVGRARPYNALANVHLLISRNTDFSFPSDHATATGAVAIGILLVNRRWGIVACVAALLMAFTRVYVGAHYPSDVVAGLALGAAVAVAGRYALVPLVRKLIDRLADTRLRRLVTAS